ncbi:hypothetical protein VTL71DRAFT_12810 [Oculimacula yallundae]|uniref:Uncharacterized protein n=1 Tax=Oculimacula yallundae TaxID=86028 RepID=A0ABR4CP20_9HELO
MGKHSSRYYRSDKDSRRTLSLQESLNNKVDTVNPPPVPIPRWQAIYNTARDDKTGRIYNQLETQARVYYERCTYHDKSAKPWDNFSRSRVDREIRKYLQNEEKWLNWDWVDETDWTALPKPEGQPVKQDRVEAALALASPNVLTMPEEAETTSGSSKDISSGSSTQNTGSSSGKVSSQQATGSGSSSNGLSSSRQLYGTSKSQSGTDSGGSSTYPASTPSPKSENGVLHETSQKLRSMTMSSRPQQTQTQASRQEFRPPTENKDLSFSKNLNSENASPGSFRPVTAIYTPNQPPEPSQLRQVMNVNQVRSTSSKQLSLEQWQTAREGTTVQEVPQNALKASTLPMQSPLEQSRTARQGTAVQKVPQITQRTSVPPKQPPPERFETARQGPMVQKVSQPPHRVLMPSQVPQAAQTIGPAGSRISEPQSNIRNKTPIIQQSRPKITLAPLTQENLKSTTVGYDVESESAFKAQTELYRGPGDNARSFIEGLVPVSTEVQRQQKAETEVPIFERVPVSEFNRGVGDMMRTNIEAMVPMSSAPATLRSGPSSSRFIGGTEATTRTSTQVTDPESSGMKTTTASVVGTTANSMRSMTQEEIRSKRQAYIEEQSQRRSANTSRFTSAGSG